MAEDGSNKWKKAIFIIVGIVVILMILIGLFAGLSNLKKFFIWLLVAILILGIIFGLLYLFYILFIRQEYKDIPASFKKKLIKTANLMKNEMLGKLYLSGDSKHNRILLGRFAYLRIRLPRQTREYIDTKRKGEFGMIEDKKEVEETTPVEVDCFVIIKQGLIDKMFADPIFILVKPEDHDHSSIFNDVTISGFNLVPLDSQFFTIDKRNLDVDIIKGMATNYIREVVYEIFRDLDKLVKQSMKLDQQHQKEKEKNLNFPMPDVQGGQNR